MTLDIAVLDEIFAHYTVDKVNMLALKEYGGAEHGDMPITIFASVDDDEIVKNDVIAVTIEKDDELARGLVTILMNFGPPDWVAVVADTFCMEGVDKMPTMPPHLEPLFEAGDPSVHEELLLLAIHRCGDGVQVHRKYVVNDGSVDMEATRWVGSPPEARMGYIWHELMRFMTLLEQVNEILEKAETETDDGSEG